MRPRAAEERKRDRDRMANVFVVQESPGKDLAAAYGFGAVQLLLEAGEVTLSTASTVRRLKSLLKDFSDDDFLLLMGDPVAIGIATAVASDVNQGRVKFLKWSRHHQSYIPIAMDLNKKVGD